MRRQERDESCNRIVKIAVLSDVCKSDDTCDTP